MIQKMSKVELIHRIILLILPLFIIALMLSQCDIYGSMIDWLSQHIAFPDYFRLMFQKTGQLFPDFSLNLGGGQNFAQYTYYGLLRPDVLVSFLLPKVAMKDIITVSSILYLLIAIQLFYQWLKNKIHTYWILLFVSCLFSLAGPLLFHTHRHIMFISYFPGLILCLIGTDNYLERKKTFWLVIGVFLMVITSYFFSVSGLVVTGIYCIYARMKMNPHESWKEFILFIAKYIGWLLLGVLISAFYLLPTACAMFLQTRPALQHPSLMELIIPKSGFASMLYDDYNIGLTVISLPALLFGFVKKDNAGRLLSFFMLLIICIPLFQYVLSGLQYIRAKSLIPFLPLLGMMIGIMMEDWQCINKKFPWIVFIISFFQIFLIKSDIIRQLFIVDMLMLILLLIFLRKKQWKHCFAIYLIIPFVVCLHTNFKEDFISNKSMEKVSDATRTNLITKTLDTYPGLYRLDDSTSSYTANYVEDVRQYKTTQYSSNSNIDYNKFYYSIMKQPMLNTNHVIIPSVENPYFLGFMGVRFLYNQDKNKGDHYNYRTVFSEKNKFIEENPNVMPVAYVSYDMMSERQFYTYTYPYSIEALYMNTVVNEDFPDISINQSVHRIKPEFTLMEKSDNLQIKKVDKGMRINSKGSGMMTLSFSESLQKNQLLIIKCKLANIKNGYKQSTEIAINNIKNKKAASSGIYSSPKNDIEYVIGAKKGISKLDFKFSKGSYSLEDFEFYVSDASLLKKRKQSVTALEIKAKDGTVISGEVNARDDGMFVTSIPYQEGLQIYIDGEKAPTEKVNTAFLGAKIKQGKHQIDIIYTMPGKSTGLLVSIAAISGCVIIWGCKKKKHWKTMKK